MTAKNKSKSITEEAAPQEVLPQEPSSEAGFSLLEIMVALVIIGLLTAAVVINVAPNIGTAQKTRAQSDIRSLTTALELYRLDLFDYPEEQDGLDALVEAPAGLANPEQYRRGGYLQGGLPSDPWGRPYIYRYPGENGEFDILSYGADGEAGGEGNNSDIVSWER
ncbi:MAG: type II secretion system major pseudopilin GspG [Maricaulaceae bacterium]